MVPDIPHPRVGVSRVQGRDPPRNLHIPNPVLPGGTSSPPSLPPAQRSTTAAASSTAGFNAAVPASVARSLRNINPSRDNLRRFQDSLGQTLDGWKTTYQNISGPNQTFQ